MIRALILLLLGLCTSCGYRFGRGEILERYSTVCVPYVEGDDQGVFTTTLIRTLTSRGSLTYSSYGSDLLLKVCLFAPSDVNIGFAYAPKRGGEFTHIVVSNEARLTLNARVTLMDRRTGACILGPLQIATSIDYDFEPDLSDLNANAFSLGQLEMHNLAQDAAYPPLYNLLAEKIVDYVSCAW